jgi:hypothetical protein
VSEFRILGRFEDGLVFFGLGKPRSVVAALRVSWAMAGLHRRDGVKLLAVGHLLRHVEQQTTIAFIDPAEQTAEAPQNASVFSTSAPRDIVGGLSLRKIRQFGWFFAVVEKLIGTSMERASFSSVSMAGTVWPFSTREI